MNKELEEAVYQNIGFATEEDVIKHFWSPYIQSLQQNVWDVEVNELNQITKIL